MTLTIPRGSTERALALLFPEEITWEPSFPVRLEDHQRAPQWDWTQWILMGGRGSGKSFTGAYYCTKYARERPGMRGRIIGPTLGDVFESCIDGPSGIRNLDPSVRVVAGAPGGSKCIFENGSEFLLLGTYGPGDVERLRASGNRHLDWWEEAAANRQFKNAWDQADFGLRLGERPHSILTTTPRNVKKLRELLADPMTAITRGTIRDNPNLTPSKRSALEKLYAGTRLGRQELDGELLTDVPGALWTWDMIEGAHSSLPSTVPDMVRVVVAIDPATTSNEDSDDTGISVVGLGTDGRGYVLADRTCHLSPTGWAKRAIAAFDEFDADRIVGETNNGGDLVETVLRGVRRDIPYTKVTASRGKAIRAEPVAALYEQGRISHVEVHTELEEQLTGWDPVSGDSPNNLDALVWGVTELGMFDRAKKGWRVG